MNDYCTGYWGAWGVLHALRLRSEQGGSWHVRVSLAQTAHWFMRMGTPHDPSQGLHTNAMWGLVDSYSESVPSPYGQLTRLRFPIGFSNYQAQWGDTVLPGTHRPEW